MYLKLEQISQKLQHIKKKQIFTNPNRYVFVMHKHFYVKNIIKKNVYT